LRGCERSSRSTGSNEYDRTENAGRRSVLDPIIDLLAEVSQGFGRIHRAGLGESPSGRADLRRNRWIMAFLIL
jgi:hypothetical protein